MPARAHCPRQTIAAGLPAFVNLKRSVNNGSDRLPPGEAVVRIRIWAMCPAVLERSFLRHKTGIRQEDGRDSEYFWKSEISETIHVCQSMQWHVGWTTISETQVYGYQFLQPDHTQSTTTPVNIKSACIAISASKRGAPYTFFAHFVTEVSLDKNLPCLSSDT
jgi:hypothetical protein